jgi:hypothetical protein
MTGKIKESSDTISYCSSTRRKQLFIKCNVKMEAWTTIQQKENYWDIW